MDYSQFSVVVVGSGFFGSVIAERVASELKRKVLVIEKRNHIGGNCFSEVDPETGIEFHTYGTHIFHTSNEKVWNYIHKFTEFNNYFHQVLTTYQNKVYQMPINLETINQFYNVNLKPFEVDDFLAKEKAKDKIDSPPKNFEEKAISLIGRPLYEAFIRGYTKKQWNKDPKDLPEFILNRLPIRKNYNESYYYSRWQGIPKDGYGKIFERMLSNPLITTQLNTNYFDIKDKISKDVILVYSGPLDQFFEYKFGKLEYRTLRFESEVHPYDDYLGTSVMNFAEESVPYTRIHEPRHLHPERTYGQKTLTIKEYSSLDDGTNPYYPINDEKNSNLVKKYREEAQSLKNVYISGRLGDYKYFDMHETIASALGLFEDKIKPSLHE
ncbi:UDP-galactopyranose mutase [Leptospira limi]|uniref:UDP-galactopyranose mutase n=1 Tax=Leptospira limi TaxID=2950023 RepID=A0ABT3LYY3_9LEPT|nr:UDP-galactopyranose mutase [Leptospira limi]MCW7462934.1 UDP-galactopyranose mutase [Leptospira limi]